MEEIKNTKVIKSFQDLEAWKACRVLYRFIRKDIYEIIPQYDYDMKNNLIRAVRSTTRNIAEGYGRYSFKENSHFVKIARASLYEIHDDFITLHEDEIIRKEIYNEAEILITNALKLTNGYINYLDKSFENKNKK